MRRRSSKEIAVMQGSLPYILHAAMLHPENKFKISLWKLLDKWISEIAPMENPEAINTIIRDQKGTFLEPFELNNVSFKAASFLTRLSIFNINNNSSRFRICSELTIGNSGGLVITNNLASFYSEVFSLGKNKLSNSNSRFFAPSMIACKPFHSQYIKDLNVHVRSDDVGLYILINASFLKLIGWVSEGEQLEFRDIAKKLSNNSLIGHKKITASSIGLSFVSSENGITIRPKSPESLIRFTSYLAQGQKLYLSALENYDAEIALPKSGEGDAPVQIIANDLFAIDWIDVKGLEAPALDSSIVAKISKWSFAHRNFRISEEG